MNLLILGICGTFMGGLALIARALGHEVRGCDAGVYPPMSTLLEREGIEVLRGYRETHLRPAPDLVLCGNVLSRGNPCVEYVLDHGIPYTSGPQWLAETVLRGRYVLAVSGTHGKTTTASLLAFLLEAAGQAPGFLIGGVPRDFGVSARLGSGTAFVVEADEYDTAFFDKRSKFVHYRPLGLIITNIEFDHGDIFPNLEAIERQFHHLVRTIPGRGIIVRPVPDPVVDEVLAMGLWSPVTTFGEGGGSDWCCRAVSPDHSAFEVSFQGQDLGTVAWSQAGAHNARNALCALAMARHFGIAPSESITALNRFQGVKRRLERLAVARGVTVYDDFAHHPTEIAATLSALRRQGGQNVETKRTRIIAVFEPRSQTMRLGLHAGALAGAFHDADLIFLYSPPDLSWDIAAETVALGTRRRVSGDIAAIVTQIADLARPGDQVVVMSNGGFGGIQERLIAALG
ncbi:MAG: UDP-N-acetylmuramate:L-alanyl-gamma-D-glutamyl-meso-diaminopimelate ligase [Pseudomonadota bacterium]|nr:UDP-N-acetylmuramate:L-alanyl-gamma-D-glutamyl-meso-diaminopimelate ligase [Gammaproteobacteria bacterium]MDQ3581641.1 UDP-N-acetylmuramate:L-alanyl-gamma-D-glutamyl-meso-diaminopimelate ligase [Pseudomonadota bacterium]